MPTVGVSRPPPWASPQAKIAKLTLEAFHPSFHHSSGDQEFTVIDDRRLKIPAIHYLLPIISSFHPLSPSTDRGLSRRLQPMDNGRENGGKRRVGPGSSKFRPSPLQAIPVRPKSKPPAAASGRSGSSGAASAAAAVQSPEAGAAKVGTRQDARCLLFAAWASRPGVGTGS